MNRWFEDWLERVKETIFVVTSFIVGATIGVFIASGTLLVIAEIVHAINKWLLGLSGGAKKNSCQCSKKSITQTLKKYHILQRMDSTRGGAFLPSFESLF